jgi:hypothetical protein
LLGQQLGYNPDCVLPIWISADNATIHHARKRMLQQRVPTQEQQAAFGQKVMHLFGSLYDRVSCRQP